MQPGGYSGDPDDRAEAQMYLNALHEWEDQRDALKKAQQQARIALDAAEQHIQTLTLWANGLAVLREAAAEHAIVVDVANTLIASTTADIAGFDDSIADVRQAYEVATARLLDDLPSAVPLVLLPLRLETQWSGSVVDLRMFPDVIAIDAHDPRLTVMEQAAGEQYWAAKQNGGPVDTDQAWAQLVRGSSPQRAAWIVLTTNPDPVADPPSIRANAWESSVTAHLLPERFAVIALSAGEPVNVASTGQPPRYVTWTNPVSPRPLPCGLLDHPDTPSWMTNLTMAREAGMAVSLTLPEGLTGFDMVAVIGLSSDTAPDLGGLLEAHAFTDGLEILVEDTPTNNSDQIRAAHSPRRDADTARTLLHVGTPPDPGIPFGTAGEQLAFTLGMEPQRLNIAGADRPRVLPALSVRLVASLGASGGLRDHLGPTATIDTWPVVNPQAPPPALRIGRQPYGLLPVTAPGRWQPVEGETSASLVPHLSQWALSTGPAVDIDPGSPPLDLGGASALHVTADDDAAMARLLYENASTLRWSGTGVEYAGPDQLIGPTDGDHAPAAYLERIAATAPADLSAIAITLPSTVLARVAFTAKQRAPEHGRYGVDQVNLALRQMAIASGDPTGRADLARELCETLDAWSHRFDAWVTGTATERLGRTEPDNLERRVGAYGWLTDLRPNPGGRTLGHVHAPSVAHAATAAVLRAGFLGQRRQVRAGQVARQRERVESLSTQREDAETRALQARRTLRDHIDNEPADLPHDAGPTAAPSSWDRQLAVLDRALRETETNRDALGAVLADERTRLAQLREPLNAPAPLDDGGESRLPMAVDLTSRRVREGIATLAAVRAGQPLGAVLGYQFERDLVAAELPQYLAMFRKLTRFHTGSALEGLEGDRRAAESKLREAGLFLDGLVAAAVRTGKATDTANAALVAARRVETAAETAASPYTRLQVESAKLADNISRVLQPAVDKVNAERKEPANHSTTIKVPQITPTKIDVIDYDLITVDVEEALAARAWAAKKASAEQALNQALDRRSRIVAILASEPAVTLLAALATARSDRGTADGEATTAQGIATAAVNAAAAYENNELRDATTAVESARRAISAALAELLSEAQTSVALTATVDGLALRARYVSATASSIEVWDHTTIPFRATVDDPPLDPELVFPTVDHPDYSALRAVLDRLDARVDTVADLVTAESVHQLVQGNSVRSGAVLDIASTGGVPDGFEVARTPISGHDITHRVLILIDPDLPHRWGVDVSGVLGEADPALGAWVSGLLPDPATVRISVQRIDDGDGTSSQPQDLTLDTLGLDPLSWVHLASDPTELHQRIARQARTVWATTMPTEQARTGRVIIDDTGPHSASGRTLRDMLSAANSVHTLLESARALTGNDLTRPPATAAVPGATVIAVAERVASVESQVGVVIASLEAATQGSDPDILIDALLAASALGEAAATPQLDTGTPALLLLQAQADAVIPRLRARTAGGTFAGDEQDPVGTLARARERIAALCGVRLPVLAKIPIADEGKELGDLDAAAPRLPGAGPAQVRGWLHLYARVRPALDAMLGLYNVAEALDTGATLDVCATQLQVADRPAGGPAPTWVGADPRPVPGTVNLVVQRSYDGDLPAAIAGLAVDAVSQTVPGTTHTSGVAFHYDQPDATAPQAVLIAVAPDLRPDRQPGTWDLATLLDVLTSTLALSQSRALSADHARIAGLTLEDLP